MTVCVYAVDHGRKLIVELQTTVRPYTSVPQWQILTNRLQFDKVIAKYYKGL